MCSSSFASPLDVLVLVLTVILIKFVGDREPKSEERSNQLAQL